MKAIILGNSGAGKSKLAQKLSAFKMAEVLSLDSVAFKHGAERMPLQDSISHVHDFITGLDQWIIEGCYADMIAPILKYCDELIFLNPSVDVCMNHCRIRQWEPEKFTSSFEQNAHLEGLLAWVRTYETRTDEYGLQAHWLLYDSFVGKKREFNDPSQYEHLIVCD